MNIENLIEQESRPGIKQSLIDHDAICCRLQTLVYRKAEVKYLNLHRRVRLWNPDFAEKRRRIIARLNHKIYLSLKKYHSGLSTLNNAGYGPDQGFVKLPDYLHI